MWGRPASLRVAELLGLSNVVQGAARAGVLDGPWGPLAVGGLADGPVAVVIRPEGVRIGPEGRIDAVVRSTTFRGASTEVVVEARGGHSLVASVASGSAPRRGDRVRVSVSADSVIPMTG